MENKTKKELTTIAKELHVKNWWTLNKAQLIEAITEIQNRTPEEKQEAAEQKAREDAALAEYQKDWRKYTNRFNPVEFIEKFRAGEIDMGDKDEEPIAETDEKLTGEEEITDNKELINEENFETETSEFETSNNSDKDENEEPSERPTPKRGALLEFDGKAQNICAWGKELGISPNTLYGRIYKMGWTIERAFTTPAKHKK